MRPKLTFATGWAAVLVGLLLLAGLELRAHSAEFKVEAVLLWGTDEATSPNPKHKPVQSELKEKLKKLPLKWKNYFEVNRKVVELPQGAARTVSLSDTCELEMKNLDGTKIEVTHFGKGKKVGTRTQALPPGEVLTIGGNAPGSTAWLVAVRRVD